MRMPLTHNKTWKSLVIVGILILKLSDVCNNFRRRDSIRYFGSTCTLRKNGRTKLKWKMFGVLCIEKVNSKRTDATVGILLHYTLLICAHVIQMLYIVRKLPYFVKTRIIPFSCVSCALHCVDMCPCQDTAVIHLKRIPVFRQDS